MRLCSLQSVKNHIVLGEPLAFSVRDAAHQLLLARGQIVHDAEQLEELFQRGALVEVSEVANAVQPQRRTARLSTDQLHGEWQRLSDEVRRALTAASDRLVEGVQSVTDELLNLIHQAPGVALAQVVRQAEGHYGVNHSIHAATACHAAARFLGWSPADQRRVFQAALTMNLSMVDLQARLATQVSPPTTLQRESIQQHPTLSAEMLRQAGVTDTLWLEAVAQHHEQPDGSGYPHGLTDVGEMASLLRFADVYTARLSARATRPALTAHQAGRELHLMADASPLAAALIKAFGIFPPGSLVRLTSGELGLVVGNGDKVYHPLVATLTDARGEPRLTPLRRDTSREGLGVVALLSPQALPMRLSDEQIAGLIVA